MPRAQTSTFCACDTKRWVGLLTPASPSSCPEAARDLELARRLTVRGQAATDEDLLRVTTLVEGRAARACIGAPAGLKGLPRSAAACVRHAVGDLRGAG